MPRIRSALIALAWLAMSANAAAAGPGDPPFPRDEESGSIVDSRTSGNRQIATNATRCDGYLSAWVAGFPEAPGNGLWLERVDDGKRVRLFAGGPDYSWIRMVWRVPPEYRGRDVRLIAIARTTSNADWISLSEPHPATTREIVASQLRFIAAPLFFVLHFAIFMLPGTVVAVATAKKTNAVDRWMLALVVNCVIGYAVFFAWFASRPAGLAASMAAIAIPAALLPLVLREPQARSAARDRDLTIPIALSLFFGLMCVGILLAVTPWWPDEFITRARFATGMPGDNGIPQTFADRLFDGEDARVIVEDWLSSDRPPLQAGIYLVQRPLMGFGGLSHELQCQLLGIACQSQWLGALWFLCRRLGVRSSKIAAALAFCAFSGFFVFNTAFPWPKFLAASLAVCCVAIVLDRGREISAKELALAAVCAALAMLAHGGVVFTLLPLAAVAILPAFRPSAKAIAISVIAAAVVFAPWLLYQKLYAPPGNRLQKMHIAGVYDADARTFSDALADQYRKAGAQGTIDLKLKNAAALVGDPRKLVASDDDRREQERFHLVPALGALNAGWPVLAFIACRRKRDESMRRWREVDAIAFGSIAVWVILMFGPGTTIVHQGSYATMILLCVSLALAILTLPRPWPHLLFAANAALFVWDWVVTTPPHPPGSLLPLPSIPMLALAAMAAVALGIVSSRLVRAAE